LTLFRLKSLEATTGYLPINCLPFMRGNSKLLVLYSSEFFGRYLIGAVVNLFSSLNIKEKNEKKLNVK
jgi:hypothetical protein